MRQWWAAAGAVVFLLTQVSCSSGTGPRTPGFYEYTITMNGQKRSVTGSDAAFWTYYPISGAPTELGVYFFIGAITGLQIEPDNALPPPGTYGVAIGGGGTTITTTIVGDSIPQDLPIDGTSSTMTISSVGDNEIDGSFTIVLVGAPPELETVEIKGRFNAARTSAFRSDPGGVNFESYP